ncbi:hypothetical protein V2G26_008231 [Clonostachys chloroleuca]
MFLSHPLLYSLAGCLNYQRDLAFPSAVISAEHTSTKGGWIGVWNFLLRSRQALGLSRPRKQSSSLRLAHRCRNPSLASRAEGSPATLFHFSDYLSWLTIQWNLAVTLLC